jgi:hypothetical protein
MPKQNRVTPFGELVEAEAKGLFMGNRGNILDEHGRVTEIGIGKQHGNGHVT